jgi:hypothetical protein
LAFIFCYSSFRNWYNIPGKNDFRIVCCIKWIVVCWGGKLIRNLVKPDKTRFLANGILLSPLATPEKLTSHGARVFRGEILSHPENSVPQTLVLRYKEIGGILCTKQRSNGIVSI